MRELFLVVVVLLFVIGFCGFLSGIWYGQQRMLDETSISSVIPQAAQDYYPYYPYEKTLFDEKYAAVF
jgi:hypothetical protein